jgi:hypothetical protein
MSEISGLLGSRPFFQSVNITEKEYQFFNDNLFLSLPKVAQSKKVHKGWLK